MACFTYRYVNLIKLHGISCNDTTIKYISKQYLSCFSQYLHFFSTFVVKEQKMFRKIMPHFNLKFFTEYFFDSFELKCSVWYLHSNNCLILLPPILNDYLLRFCTVAWSLNSFGTAIRSAIHWSSNFSNPFLLLFQKNPKFSFQIIIQVLY